MSIFHVHGGGTPGSVSIADVSTIVRPTKTTRKYLEIQNESADNGGARVHLSISDDADAEYGKGLYLDPGAVYTVTAQNLSYARISAIAGIGLTTTLYFQEG